MCTLEEVVTYLYTAFCEFPPSQERTRVYLWASNRVLQTRGRLPVGQTVWDLIEGAGLGQQELSDYDQREYLADCGATSAVLWSNTGRSARKPVVLLANRTQLPHRGLPFFPREERGLLWGITQEVHDAWFR